MTDGVTPGRVVVHRYMDDEHEAIFARVEVAPLFDAWLDHARLWLGEPDGLTSVMMRQALGGAALHMSCRPWDEHSAWTFNIHAPALNLFVVADGPRASIAGRVWTEGVAVTESSRLFVQTRRSHSQSDHTSVISIEGLDVLEIMDKYYLESDQTDARFYELSDDAFLLVKRLPLGDSQWMRELDRETAREHLDGLRTLDDREVWLQCGCHRKKIVEVVTRACGGDPDRVFEGAESLDVSCPRCGRRWPITPADVLEWKDDDGDA